MVDFVLVAAPLVLLALSVLGIALSSFTLMVLRDSAVEGAGFAALADQESLAGCARARELAQPLLAGIGNLSATCESNDDGDEIVVLKVKAPVFGLLSGVRDLSATGRAPREN